MNIHLFPILRDFEVTTTETPFSEQLARDIPVWYWLNIRNFLFLLNLRRFEARGKIASPGMYYMTILNFKVVDLYKAKPEQVLTWL